MPRSDLYFKRILAASLRINQKGEKAELAGLIRKGTAVIQRREDGLARMVALRSDRMLNYLEGRNDGTFCAFCTCCKL